MTGWLLRSFKGRAPRMNPRLLQDNQAQASSNVNFKRGILTPLKTNASVATLTKSGVIQSIYRFGQDVSADDKYWLHWSSDVDVVRGFVAGDAQERTYYTDGETAKVIDNENALTGQRATALSISAALQRIVIGDPDDPLMTRLKAAFTSGPYNGRIKGDVTNSGDIKLDDAIACTKYSVGLLADQAQIDFIAYLIESLNTANPAGAYPFSYWTLGVPFPATAPIAVKGGTPTSATALDETRGYVCTFVTAWGEEGCPSDVSNEVTVKPGETVTLTLPSIPTGSYNFYSKRIYRIVTGSTTSTYLFVDEVLAATTEYVDSKLADLLGEEIPSIDYNAPPVGLRGLTAGPGGVMAGFVGKDVYFCEPFIPHAFPEKYIQTVDAEIVGIGVFDTTFVIFTKSNPYLISGSHPDSYVMVKSDLDQACLSKRSIAQVDGGVIYASPDGLFLISGSGSRNLTENLFSRAEWQAINHSTLSGYIVDNQYVGFYNNTSGFALDLMTGDWTDLPYYASAGYYDPIRDQLFLVVSNNQLVKFNTGTNQTISWKSKQFYTPVPINLGVARVEAESYPVTLKVYGDGVLKHTQSVTSAQAFNLPSGYRANVWEMEVSGIYEIYSVGMAQSLTELMNG